MTTGLRAPVTMIEPRTVEPHSMKVCGENAPMDCPMVAPCAENDPPPRTLTDLRTVEFCSTSDAPELTLTDPAMVAPRRAAWRRVG
jgi:hypothetical protein